MAGQLLPGHFKTLHFSVLLQAREQSSLRLLYPLDTADHKTIIQNQLNAFCRQNSVSSHTLIGHVFSTMIGSNIFYNAPKPATVLLIASHTSYIVTRPVQPATVTLIISHTSHITNRSVQLPTVLLNGHHTNASVTIPVQPTTPVTVFPGKYSQSSCSWSSPHQSQCHPVQPVTVSLSATTPVPVLPDKCKLGIVSQITATSVPMSSDQCSQPSCL